MGLFPKVVSCEAIKICKPFSANNSRVMHFYFNIPIGQGPSNNVKSIT